MPTPSYAFAHVIGYFIFDEKFSIMDTGDEHRLRKKYPTLIEITEQNIEAYKQALQAIKTPHSLPLFYEKNKLAVRESLKSVANNDNFIIQAVASMDEITRARGMLLHRLGEWCSLFYPEVSKTKDVLSLGVTMESSDAVPIKQLTNYINELSQLWEEQFTYLKKTMGKHCPNLAVVAGYELGGRLIAQSGSLEQLSRMASSQIQVLGAEKAFFRHLLKQTPLPKYGLVFLHQRVKQVPDGAKAKAARSVAEKIAIAVKVDYFKGEFIGEKLRKDLEK